jgi:hypothetical protein
MIRLNKQITDPFTMMTYNDKQNQISKSIVNFYCLKPDTVQRKLFYTDCHAISVLQIRQPRNQILLILWYLNSAKLIPSVNYCSHFFVKFELATIY